MVFRIDNCSKLAQARLKRTAKQNLLYFPRRTAEISLNKYLMETEKLSLIQACFLIINNLKVSRIDNSVIITILDSRLEKLAQLITYGNESIYGSKILTASIIPRKEIKKYGM